MALFVCVGGREREREREREAGGGGGGGRKRFGLVMNNRTNKSWQA